jgi:hypothetical protein
MTNPMRGQVEITLGEDTYNCRLTIDSLIKIEDELNDGILQLAQKIANADVRLKTLVTVLRYALRGGGNDVSDSDVQKIISNVGLVVASTQVAHLLAATLSDSKSEEKSEGKSEKVAQS